MLLQKKMASAAVCSMRLFAADHTDELSVSVCSWYFAPRFGLGGGRIRPWMVLPTRQAHGRHLGVRSRDPVQLFHRLLDHVRREN